MQQAKDDIPVKIETPDAVARQRVGFGDTSDYGELSGEYFTLNSGTDISPLLEGLKDDLCQAPHWGTSSKVPSLFATRTEQRKWREQITSSTGRLATRSGLTRIPNPSCLAHSTNTRTF